MKKFLSYFFAIILIFSAIAHLVMPEAYAPLIPEFIPAIVANGLSFIIELILGIALLIPSKRHLGGLGFAILMIAFLPIHTWDLMKETPAMGSASAASIRLVFQFALIAAGFWIYRSLKSYK